MLIVDSKNSKLASFFCKGTLCVKSEYSEKFEIMIDSKRTEINQILPLLRLESDCVS